MTDKPSPEKSSKPGDRSARVLLGYLGVAVLFSVVVLYLALFVLPPLLVPSSKAVSFAVLAKAEDDARGSLLTGLGVLAAIVVGTAGFLNWRESHRTLEETRRENDLNWQASQATLEETRRENDLNWQASQATLEQTRMQNDLNWQVSQATLEQTRMQNDETHRQNLLDLYSKAVDQLGQAGAEKLNTRVGAVHILEEVSRDTKVPELYWPIIEIFVTLLREGPPASERTAQTRFPPDLEAALRALGRRKGSDRFPIDLSGAWLVGADFRAPDNEGNFVPDLKDVSFVEANLTGANFWRAKLIGADFRCADLSGANLTYCDLKKADFSGANLTGANLSFGLMFDVMLDGADFRDANLTGVQGIPMAQLQLAPAAAVTIGDLLAEQGAVAIAKGDLPTGQDAVAIAKKAYQQAINSGHVDWAPAAEVNLRALLARQGDAAGRRHGAPLPPPGPPPPGPRGGGNTVPESTSEPRTEP